MSANIALPPGGGPLTPASAGHPGLPELVLDLPRPRTRGPMLLGIASIALFVGAFVIFSTFSITVAQRMREFAMLRTLGASSRQVMATVLIEAALVGLLASLLGGAAGSGVE